MKIPERLIVVAFAILLLSTFLIGEALAGATEDCAALMRSDFSGRIIKTEVVPAAGKLPEYCKVTGTLPQAVTYEVRLPTTVWNGKFLFVGGGGYCGEPPYTYLNGADDVLARGYAITATDTGHAGPSSDASFGYNNDQAEIDWGFRADHIVTVAAKYLIRDFYGRLPAFSYWRGCSMGGRQGLMEAERFPQDFDGIIVGDPSQYMTAMNAVLMSWGAKNNYSKGQRILTADKLPLITNAVYAACDGIDGLKDGIIDDPRRCNFDPASMMCPSGNPGANCLSTAQVEVVRKLYDAPRNSAGKPLYPGGLVKGSEVNWQGYVGSGSDLGRNAEMGQEALRYLLFKIDPGPLYSILDFNYDTDVSKLRPKSKIYNTDSYNLSSFRKLGGKLILYTGLADAHHAIQDVYYYGQMVKHMGGLSEIQNWYRFFPVPGMYHCTGGPGPNVFDMLTPLEDWVEHGKAPDRIIASHFTSGVVDRTRPLCPYPKVSRHKGSGSINEAANFVCVEPDYQVPVNDWDNIDRFPWQ